MLATELVSGSQLNYVEDLFNLLKTILEPEDNSSCETNIDDDSWSICLHKDEPIVFTPNICDINFYFHGEIDETNSESITFYPGETVIFMLSNPAFDFSSSMWICNDNFMIDLSYLYPTYSPMIKLEKYAKRCFSAIEEERIELFDLFSQQENQVPISQIDYIRVFGFNKKILNYIETVVLNKFTSSEIKSMCETDEGNRDCFGDIRLGFTSNLMTCPF